MHAVSNSLIIIAVFIAMDSVHLLSLIIIGAWLMPQCTVGQIPTACADEDSLENLRCCPETTDDGVCGEDANRGEQGGECVQLNLDGHRMDTTDVRANWPHYFTYVSYTCTLAIIYIL